MSRGWWAVAKAAGGLLVLGMLAARVGTAPFVAGLKAVEPASVVAAMGLTALTTAVSAQRWRLVGRAYGVRMTLRRQPRRTTAPSSSTPCCPAACSVTCTAASGTGQ